MGRSAIPPRSSERYLDAIADAETFPYWLDDVDEPDSNPTAVHNEDCDLCVVGGGFTGLWTAIIAKQRNANSDVVLIEAHEIGSGASSRNGGFMDYSLTHGDVVVSGKKSLSTSNFSARRSRALLRCE